MKHRRRSNSLSTITVTRIVAIIALVGVAVFSCSQIYMGTEKTLTITVNDKERINTRDDSYYLVFTDRGEFKIEDTILYSNWNSSTLYGKLKEGEKYTITVVGWRSGVLSMYPNIVKIH